MRNARFEIINVKKRSARPCAKLAYDERSGWRLDINPDANIKDVPAFFIPFIEKGQFIVEDEWARRWVNERITPSGRQNLGEVLNAHELLEYDEVALLRSSRGRTSLDDYAVIELDSNESKENMSNQQRREREALGWAIKARRTCLGLSQSDLAKMVGVYQSAMSNIESGKTNPTFNLLLEISDALNISIERLLTPKAASLWNEKRQHVLSLLMDLSEELGQMYQRLVDELETYVDDADSALADSMVIAHCFRELLNAFPDYVTRSSLDKGRQGEGERALKRAVEQLDSLSDAPLSENSSYEIIPRELGDALRQLKNAAKAGTRTRKKRDYFSLYGSQNSIGTAVVPWEEVRDLAGKAHMQRSDSPHAEKASDYLQALESLESSIGTRLGNVLDSKSMVDKALRRANSVDGQGKHACPRQEEVTRVLALLNDNHLEWRFYSELKNPRWFEVLDEMRAFDQCLTATTHQGTTNDFLVAPYFLFCAKIQPGVVVRFIERHVESENFHFRRLVRDLATDLPCDLTRRISQVYVQWIGEGFQQDSYFWSPSEMLPVVKKLLSSDARADKSAGIKLFTELVKMRSGDGATYGRSVYSFMSQHHYGEFVADALECMSVVKRLNVCSDHLNDYISLNQWNDQRHIPSTAILPDLVPSESDFELSFRVHVYVWIDELRKAIVECLSADAPAVGKWLEKASAVVRRVAYLALADFMTKHQDNPSYPEVMQLAEKLIDCDALYTREYEDEALVLLGACAALLDRDFATQFLSQHTARLLREKKKDKKRYLVHYQNSADAEKEALRQLDISSWQILSQFNQESLPDIWLRELQALERKLGKYTRVEHAYEVKTVTGPNAPVTIGTLLKMGPTNAIRYLRKWTPSQAERFQLIEPLGLSRELQKLIEQNPDFFSGHYGELRGLRLIYASGIVIGWKRAVEAKATLSFEDVVGYCSWLLEAEYAEGKASLPPSDSSSDYREIRIEIARLVESILDMYGESLKKSQMRRLLDMLESLAATDPRISEGERAYDESDDPFMASLNMLYPVTLTAVGKWIANGRESDRSEMERAYGILDTALPPNTESRAEITALAMAIGWLLDMDSPWLHENREALFGGENPDANQRLLIALLVDLYMPNESLFAFMRPALLTSLEKGGKGYLSGTSFRMNGSFMGRLGEWIYWLFTNEKLSFDDDFFTAWFDRADGKTRGEVLNQLCLMLEKSPNAPNHVAESVRCLWEYHRRVAVDSPASLKGAIHLLASHRFGEEWIKSALLDEARLGNLPDRMLVFQNDAIDLMLKDSIWGIEFLRTFLEFESDKQFLYTYEEFVPSLFRNYISQGGHHDDQALLDCMDKLVRMGMLDLDACVVPESDHDDVK